MAVAITQIAADDKSDDFDGTTRRSVEQALFWRVAKGDDQLAEEVGNAAVRNICCTSVESESPGHRVKERFLELVHFEVLVSDTLLVDADTLDGQ